MSIVDGTSKVCDKKFTAKLHICQPLMQYSFFKFQLREKKLKTGWNLYLWNGSDKYCLLIYHLCLKKITHTQLCSLRHFELIRFCCHICSVKHKGVGKCTVFTLLTNIQAVAWTTDVKCNVFLPCLLSVHSCLLWITAFAITFSWLDKGPGGTGSDTDTAEGMCKFCGFGNSVSESMAAVARPRRSGSPSCCSLSPTWRETGTENDVWQQVGCKGLLFALCI